MLPSSLSTLLNRLAFAGVGLFIVLTLLLWIVNAAAHPYVAAAALSYGALMVALLSGVHWGVVLRDPEHHTPLLVAWPVVPTFIAWLAAQMPPYAGLPLLGLVFVACYWVDRKTWPAAGLGPWLTQRFRLTALCTLCCVLGAAAT